MSSPRAQALILGAGARGRLPQVAARQPSPSLQLRQSCLRQLARRPLAPASCHKSCLRQSAPPQVNVARPGTRGAWTTSSNRDADRKIVALTATSTRLSSRNFAKISPRACSARQSFAGAEQDCAEFWPRRVTNFLQSAGVGPIMSLVTTGASESSDSAFSRRRQRA